MNNYIIDYYQKISDGTINAPETIKAWYRIVLDGLKNKEYRYEPKRAERVKRFVENFCRHHEGPLAPSLISLELWQKAFIAVVYGCIDDTGYRHFREVFLVEGRKNGKTLLAAALSCYHAFFDDEYGGRVYFIAPKLEQARLCFNAFFEMVRKDDELNALAKKRRTDVYIESSNTTIAPIAFNAKKSDGFNPSYVCADEIASWIGDAGLKQYEVLGSAFGARRQPLLMAITTAGYIDEGIYDELIKRATSVLKGTSKETRFAPFIYQIDNEEKWNDLNELQKSMPNLGVSVSYEYMLEEIAKAEGSLSKRAEFKTKYCNIKQNSSIAWLESKYIQDASGDALKLEDFRNCYCVVGIDLSKSIDLSAVTVVIEKKGILNVFARFYLPSARIADATARDGLPYDAFIQRGILYPSGENYIDYHDIETFLNDLVRKYKILPLVVGYDRYSATYLIQDLKQAGYTCDDVYQGENLSSVIDFCEAAFKDGRINIGDNDLLKVHLLNAAMKRNSETDRRKLVKIKPSVHIDGTAALLDALTVRQKWHGEYGAQLANMR